MTINPLVQKNISGRTTFSPNVGFDFDPLTPDLETDRFHNSSSDNNDAVVYEPKGLKGVKLFRGHTQIQSATPRQPNRASPDNIAQAMFDTLKARRSVVAVKTLHKKYAALTKKKPLECVFHSPAMNQVLDQRSQYQTVDHLYATLSANQMKLVSCLGLIDKVYYGSKLKSLVNQTEAHEDALTSIVDVYAQALGKQSGHAYADLLCYFIRPDKLSTSEREIFDNLVRKMNQISNKSQRRSWFW